MQLSEVNELLTRMFKHFPAGYDTPAARQMLLTIGLQESRFTSRRQLINKVVDGKKVLVPEGPAIGFWQFELGNKVSRGGVWGVLNHFRVGSIARAFATALGYSPTPEAVWAALETNDILAAGFARLLLMCDAQALPKIGEVNKAWELYAERTWRPGKPHRDTWDAFYSQARKELGV